MYVARYVIKRFVNPQFLSSMAYFDVASSNNPSLGCGRAALQRVRTAGIAVTMGNRVATAIDDNSKEAIAARKAERLSINAVASVADACAALDALELEAEQATSRLVAPVRYCSPHRRPALTKQMPSYYPRFIS